MKPYGSTYNKSVASDVNYGDGCFGEPTRTNRLKSKNRSRCRRWLHRLGRKEASNSIDEQLFDSVNNQISEE